MSDLGKSLKSDSRFVEFGLDSESLTPVIGFFSPTRIDSEQINDFISEIGIIPDIKNIMHNSEKIVVYSSSSVARRKIMKAMLDSELFSVVHDY